MPTATDYLPAACCGRRDVCPRADLVAAWRNRQRDLDDELLRADRLDEAGRVGDWTARSSLRAYLLRQQDEHRRIVAAATPTLPRCGQIAPDACKESR